MVSIAALCDEHSCQVRDVNKKGKRAIKMDQRERKVYMFNVSESVCVCAVNYWRRVLQTIQSCTGINHCSLSLLSCLIIGFGGITRTRIYCVDHHRPYRRLLTANGRRCRKIWSSSASTVGDDLLLLLRHHYGRAASSHWVGAHVVCWRNKCRA